VLAHLSGPLYLAYSCRLARLTLLNCLTAAVPARERVITCEEVFELRKTHKEVSPRRARHESSTWC
jgi:pilus assembly protein CpaF